MPLYDCGDPDCHECKRAFGPDRRKAIERHEAREASPYPLQSPALRIQAAKEDRCPECGGSLDTGWECNRCGFDAMKILPKHFTSDPGAGP